MIDETSMNRIIGDYMEINADIISAQLQSKYPKFISKFIAKRQKKKLISSIEKFRNSDYILNWYNLIEYFEYIYNRFFDADRSYKSITKVAMNKLEYDIQLEAVFKIDKIIGTVFFDAIPEEPSSNDHIKFNLVMRDQYIHRQSTSSLNIYVDKLEFKSERNGYMVELLNQTLKNDICDFMIEIITNEKEL